MTFGPEPSRDHRPMLMQLARMFDMTMETLLLNLAKLNISVEDMYDRCCQDDGSGIIRVVLAARGILHSKSAGGVLLVQRQDGRLELPGGKIGSAMSFRQALVMEFLEETGIAVSVDECPVHIWDKPAGMPPKWVGVPYCCIVSRVHLVHPTCYDVILSDEHMAFVWLDPTPANLIPYGDQIPEETRRALDIFYRMHFYIPEMAAVQSQTRRQPEVDGLHSRIELLEAFIANNGLTVP